MSPRNAIWRLVQTFPDMPETYCCAPLRRDAGRDGPPRDALAVRALRIALPAPASGVRATLGDEHAEPALAALQYVFHVFAGLSKEPVVLLPGLGSVFQSRNEPER